MRGQQRRLMLFIGAVCALALVTAWLTRGPAELLFRSPSLVMVALALILVVGETHPMQVSAGDDLAEFTISGTFAFALMLLAPFPFALVAQLAAVAFDDVRRGKPAVKVVFNAAQYTLSLSAARLVYAGLSYRMLAFDPRLFTPRDLLPALLAALVYFLLNSVLTGWVVAIANRQPVLARIVSALRFQVLISAALLALAPIVVMAVNFSAWTLPLLLLPIAGAHNSTRQAVEREHQGMHDDLTGLANRPLLDRRLRQAMKESEAGQQVALMLIDLDHFKDINDTLGHAVGDELLALVAARLSKQLGPDDTLARLGGDEFAFLATGLQGGEGAEVAARRVTDAIREPFALHGVRLDVRASVGIATYPEHGNDVGSLLQRADIALYRAKTLRGSAEVYREELDEHSLERLTLLGELRQAVSRREFVLHYQPKCRADDGSNAGVEALVRWQHPTRGLLQPDAFISLAENTDLIADLTRLVLDEALAQAAAWRRDGREIKVSVNLSACQLSDTDLPGQVLEQLTHHGVPPDGLMFEVTEGSIMADPARAVAVLSRLRHLGVELAIDDFGTGYSSLAYLKRLAVDELKIDKSFVLNMTTDEHDVLIVRSTIDLAHGLGLRVVAEGVESAQVAQVLADLGCDLLQGYYLGRPVPAAAFALPPPRPLPHAGTPMLEIVPTPKARVRWDDKAC